MYHEEDNPILAEDNCKLYIDHDYDVATLRLIQTTADELYIGNYPLATVIAMLRERDILNEENKELKRIVKSLRAENESLERRLACSIPEDYVFAGH